MRRGSGNHAIVSRTTPASIPWCQLGLKFPSRLKYHFSKNKTVPKIIPAALFASAIITAIITAGPAYGHKLISHDGAHTDFNSALQIPDHRISWAIYDDLGAGGAKFYAFDAERGDSFYAGISVPKVDGLKEYSPSLFLVSPAGFENDPALPGTWPNAEKFPYMGEFPGDEFYEPFGQVTYWERQEVRTHIPIDGKYFIAVADEKGRAGKYVLAVGTIEDFSGENLLVVLPMAWLETKLFVNDYLSLGIFFLALAAAPAVAALAVTKRRSRRSVSKIR